MAEDAVAAKRRRRCTGGGGDMVALPEHVLQEILSRVGTVKDLFMFAATCRRWLSCFTDRTFLRELLCPGQGQGQSQSLLGFFLQDARQGATMATTRTEAARQLASACSFLPAPGSPLAPGPTARALTSSLVADGDGAFDYAVPLAARRGIVLMQCVPRRRDTHLLLGVCNPVTGERHLLAPLRRNPTRVCGYAIITAADADADAAGRFTFSQLLVAIVQPSDWVVHLHSYSAATRSWSAPTVCVVNCRCFSLRGQRSAVVHQGAAHWLYHTSGLYDDGGQRALPASRDDGSLFMLSVQLGGGAAAAGGIGFAFTRIPVRVGGISTLLCVTGDGNLAVVCGYMSHVAVSTCREQRQAGGGGGGQAWERTAFKIPAAVPYPDTAPMWQPKEKWFDLTRGSMLVLYRSSAVFIVDLHSKTMEKVMDCFLPLFADQMKRTAVPYEMDLVDFFMLKLGGLSSTRSSG
ncbi:hypothetical protein SORBI_3004G178600 [Sorghum bicolor]|uniref:F-box domain-containing protein n=1 Tax=Sorghum bicolor TaxID=4558 RepID=A0A194YRG7_SORBI|nr:hypothetical protein SORBI_3004G178600 [Sorghum bicolor]